MGVTIFQNGVIEFEPRGFESHATDARGGAASVQAQYYIPNHEVNKEAVQELHPLDQAGSERPSPFSILHAGIEAKRMPFCSRARPKPAT